MFCHLPHGVIMVAFGEFVQFHTAFDARPARLGQNHAGQADAHHPARSDANRVDRNHADLQRRGPTETGLDLKH